jgi:hypothetical protein
MRNVPTMWPPMSNPLTNFTAPPRSIWGVAQVGIVIDYGEPLDEDNDSSKRKHNLRILENHSYWKTIP